MWASEFKKVYVVDGYVDVDGVDESTVQPCPGREAEYEERFKIFVENVAKASTHNVESKGLPVHGITKFMDLSRENFCARPRD